MSFEALKRNREEAKQKLLRTVEKINSSQNKKFDNEDDRFWKPETDKSGTGFAVIRFLQHNEALEPDGKPFVQYYDHFFQGPGGWYVEKCPTSIGKECPACAHNSKLWNSGSESNKEIARDRKRRLHYVANIYVVHDPANPSNEGKVFFYRFGKKIYDKINDKMFPSYPDEKPMIPFDLFEGANFRLKVRKVDGFPNYDKSDFDDVSPVSEDEDTMKKIYESIRPLQELMDPSTFKSMEELSSKHTRAIGEGSGQREYSNVEDVTEDDDEEDNDILKSVISEAESRSESSPPWENDSSSSNDEDDEADWFRKLGEG